MICIQTVSHSDGIAERFFSNKARVFYFLFYRFFQPDARVGGRKKNKNKIQGRLYFISDISDVKVGGRKKKEKRSTSFP